MEPMQQSWGWAIGIHPEWMEETLPRPSPSSAGEELGSTIENNADQGDAWASIYAMRTVVTVGGWEAAREQPHSERASSQVL